MPVIIVCPTCHADVRLLVGGTVAAHGDPRCPFTRTPSSKTKIRSPKEVKAATTAAQLAEAVRQRDLRVAARVKEAAELAAVEAKKRLKAVCPVCGRQVRVNRGTATGLSAHLNPNSRWCAGGAEPTEAQRNKARAKRSVWAVSGGLPGLGRR